MKASQNIERSDSLNEEGKEKEDALLAIKEKQRRTPGLLGGQLNDAFFEPLPEDELQQWGEKKAALPVTNKSGNSRITSITTNYLTLITLESVAKEYGWTVIDNTLCNRAGKKVHDIKIKRDRVHFFSGDKLRGTIPVSQLQNLGKYLEKTFYAKKLEIVDRPLVDKVISY